MKDANDALCLWNGCWTLEKSGPPTTIKTHNTNMWITKGSYVMSTLLTQGVDQACGQTLYLSEAETCQRYQQLAARQSILSRARLCEQQAALLGPGGIFSKLSRQVAAQGRQAPALNNVPELENALHEQQANKAVEFMLGLHHRRARSGNPFHSLSRQALCCVVFDDFAQHTLAERFAACEALRQRDSLYFAKLIATTRHTVERRLVFIGLLEHFDALLPIEQSIYPLDYRRAQQRHLEQEEKLYGQLQLDRSVSELLEEHSPQWLLDNLCSAENSTA
jgi:hypothetical protein